VKSVYKPRSGTELAMLKSLLVSEEIPFTVLNDGFGSLEVGPQIGLFNERIIQVPDEHAERAEEVIRDFLAATADVAPTENYSFFDKVLGVAESWVRKWRPPSRR
jgi:hypothetical protein